QLLARAGLAVDQDRDIAMRQPANSTKDLLHGGRFTDNWRGLLFLLFAWLTDPLLIANGMRERPLDNDDGFIEVEGLWQIVEGAFLITADSTFEVRMSGHDDDRYS